MFTGIIEGMGVVKRITRRGADVILELETDMDVKSLKAGDSVCVNGACLTVTELNERGFTADVSAETLSRTYLGNLKAGDRVNLEKSLRVGDYLGGHIVLGHVDGQGRVFERKAMAGSVIFGIQVEKRLGRYIVEKGSVAVDGISLTVNECQINWFYVNIVPHTAGRTTLGFKKVGDVVNVETDILGKYVEKLLRKDEGEGGIRKPVDLSFLVEHGYIK